LRSRLRRVAAPRALLDKSSEPNVFAILKLAHCSSAVPPHTLPGVVRWKCLPKPCRLLANPFKPARGIAWLRWRSLLLELVGLVVESG